MRIGISILLITTIITTILFISCESNDPVIPTYENINSSGDNDSETINSEDFTTTVTEALADNLSDHEDTEDYVWNESSASNIILAGNSITVEGTGATTDGSVVTITSAGTYKITGNLTDGQIIVETEDEETVRLLFSGVDINCNSSAPVFIKQCEKTVIVLADNTENFIADGSAYVYESEEDDEPNATIFSKDDLTLYGNGYLEIDANYNDAIASKDGLIIKSGDIFIDAVDDGIRGKDYLIIMDGNIEINATGDGLKSDNEDDAAAGYVLIEKGEISITAGGDAIQAQTDALITNGNITIVSGGGSSQSVAYNSSAKGIKGVVNTIIDGGTIEINSADDAVHSNGSMAVNGGEIDVSSNDDGFHADEVLGVNEGILNINKSYEGIESKIITIASGTIHINASDDGLNVAGGNDGSGMGGWPGQTSLTSTSDYYLKISGGYIAVNATGDGIDANGSIEMSGGNVIVHGPTQSANGALDYDGSFKISGGFFVAAGSSGMAQAPGTSSTQNSLLMNFTTQEAGILVNIQSASGESILTFSPEKTYQSIAFSSPELETSNTYNVYFEGSSTGTVNDGLYTDGEYSAGSLYTNFTVSSVVTKLGSTNHSSGIR